MDDRRGRETIVESVRHRTREQFVTDSVARLAALRAERGRSHLPLFPGGLPGLDRRGFEIKARQAYGEHGHSRIFAEGSD